MKESGIVCSDILLRMVPKAEASERELCVLCRLNE